MPTSFALQNNSAEGTGESEQSCTAKTGNASHLDDRSALRRLDKQPQASENTEVYFAHSELTVIVHEQNSVATQQFISEDADHEKVSLRTFGGAGSMHPFPVDHENIVSERSQIGGDNSSIVPNYK